MAASGDNRAGGLRSRLAGALGRRAATAVPGLAAIALVLLLAGCSLGGEESPSTSAPPPGNSTTTSAGPADTDGGPSTTASGGSATTAPPSADDLVQTETERLAPRTGTFSTCPDCHPFLDVPGQVPRTLTQAFAHVRHLDRGAACDSCHEAPVHRATGVRRPTMARCFTCHSTETGKPSGECDYCHPADFPRVPASHTQDFFGKGHSQVVAQQGPEQCLFCHKGTAETFCRGCHGVDLPHPSGWVTTASGEPGAHVQAAYEQGQTCVKCHDNRTEPPGNCYGGECHGS